MFKIITIILMLVTSNAFSNDKKEFFNWGYFEEDVQKSILVRKVTYNKRFNVLIKKEEDKKISVKEEDELKNLRVFFKKNPDLLMEKK